MLRSRPSWEWEQWPGEGPALQRTDFWVRFPTCASTQCGGHCGWGPEEARNGTQVKERKQHRDRQPPYLPKHWGKLHPSSILPHAYRPMLSREPCPKQREAEHHERWAALNHWLDPWVHGRRGESPQSWSRVGTLLLLSQTPGRDSRKSGQDLPSSSSLTHN